jgi:hypothetical protein
MVMRRPRAVLDPLGRAAGRDILVYSESELRSALGAIAQRGEPGRVVIAGSFALASKVKLTPAIAGTVFTSAGAASIFCSSDVAFEIDYSATGTRHAPLRFDGLSLLGETSSDISYANKFIDIAARPSAVSISNIIIVGCRLRCKQVLTSASEGLADSLIADNHIEHGGGPASGYVIDVQNGGGAGGFVVRGNMFQTHLVPYDAIRTASSGAVSGNSVQNGRIYVSGSRSVISGNMRFYSITATGTRQSITGNVGHATPGGIDTSGGSGFCVIAGNAGAGTITAHGTDQVGNNT